MNDINRILGLVSVTLSNKMEKGVNLDVSSYIDNFEGKYSHADKLASFFFVTVHTLISNSRSAAAGKPSVPNNKCTTPPCNCPALRKHDLKSLFILGNSLLQWKKLTSAVDSLFC